MSAVKYAVPEVQTSGDAPASAPIRRPLARVLRGPVIHPKPRSAVPDPKDLAAVREWVLKAQGPTAIDLFCGAGGLSLGLHNAGFRVLVGADMDPWSVETHSANLGSLGYTGDLSDSHAFLRDMRRWGITKVDLVAGGVPCQPFSRAGRSKIRDLVARGRRPSVDPRAGLWRPFLEIVKGLNPRAVLIENVPDLTVWNDGAALAGICDLLRDLGYRPDARLLNAYEYGVPQHRSRLVIVATRPGTAYNWPDKGERTTVQDAIGDLPKIGAAQRNDQLVYETPAEPTWLQDRMRLGVPDDEAATIYDHITRDVRPDDAEAFSLMKEGQIYADLPKRLQRYRSDIFDDKYKRLSWKGLSRSITAHIAKDGYWYIHPAQDRTLSVREAARIQTFPDWFRFAGQPSQQYRQIGNAVPPLLAEVVGLPLAAALGQPARRGRPPESSASFRRDLLEWHAGTSTELPWRRCKDPWQVLMGALCLSRTSAKDANRLFPALCAAVPSPAALVGDASAPSQLISSACRAKLSDVAQAIVQQSAGVVPESAEGLRSLPHLGEWVVSTVMVYGQHEQSVVLDEGAARVAARLRGDGSQSHWQARVDLRRLSGKSGPDAPYNAAIHDLALLVCRKRSPLCAECPARAYCGWRRIQTESADSRRARGRGTMHGSRD